MAHAPTDAKPSPTDEATTDTERLARLRDLVAADTGRAQVEAWRWLRELQAPRRHGALPWLFAQGTAPVSPDGDCEGIVMGLDGSLWLTGLDRLVRLGQTLGGIGWTGKSFDADAGTGYNRLTGTSRLPALLVLPTYRFGRSHGELTGFPFHHSVQPSPVAPHRDVRAITYDAPEHHNPLVLPRTRDEVVEVVPEVLLGRALLRHEDDWQVVGYFGLRTPHARRS